MLNLLKAKSKCPRVSRLSLHNHYPILPITSTSPPAGLPARTAEKKSGFEQKLRDVACVVKQIDPEDLVILNPIGSGQNGFVTKALYLPDWNLVALKKVEIGDDDKTQQILNELQALSVQKCEQLIGLIGIYFEEGTITLVLEFMNCGSLHALLEEKCSFPETILKQILRQALLGLAYLHRNGQVHGDIKPENILLNSDGEIKLCDFGLATILNGKEKKFQQFSGTTMYLSPERARNQAWGYPADIWSLGMSVMILLGKAPLSPDPDIWKVIEFTRVPAPLLPSSFSSETISLVSRCLELESEKRPSAETLLSDLAQSSKADESLQVKWSPSPITREELFKITTSLCEYLSRNEVFSLSEIHLQHVSRLSKQLGILPETLRKEIEFKLQILPRRTPEIDTASSHSSPLSSPSSCFSLSPCSTPSSVFSPSRHLGRQLSGVTLDSLQEAENELDGDPS